MSIVQWLYGMTLSVDPDAIKDYEWDFEPFLQGDTLASVTVDAEACTASVRGNTDTTGTVRVSDVAAGAKVTVTINTTAGQSEPFTINFKPLQR